MTDDPQLRFTDEDNGSVMLLTLVCTGLLVALGIGLISMANTERALAANYQSGAQALYAAEALVERAVVDLAEASSWTAVLASAEPASFSERASVPTTPWGEPVDVVGLTAELQRNAHALSLWGADTPVWRPFAWGDLTRVIDAGPTGTPAYGVAWIADDLGESDGDPRADANGVLMLRALAITPGGLRRTVELALKRDEGHSSVIAAQASGASTAETTVPGEVARNLPAREEDMFSGTSGAGGTRILSWREVR